MTEQPNPRTGATSNVVELPSGKAKRTRAADDPSRDPYADAPDQSSRDQITLSPEAGLVTDRAVSALSNAKNLYTRGGALVQVVTSKPLTRRASKPGAILRPPDAPRIALAAPAAVRERLARVATWLGHDKHGKPTNVLPPDWVVKMVLARGEWPYLRPLEGVAEVPVLRADGSIHDAPGYDDATGVLYMPGLDVPPLPPCPTVDHAREAVRVLLDVVCDFPFESAEHRAAWLAGALTPFARHAFAGPSPLFLIDKPVRGVGGTLAAETIGLIYTGRTLARMTQAINDDEERKRILALAIGGDPLILIDNVDRPLGSAALDAALTGEAIADRILTRSEFVTVPIRATWFATGNNVAVNGDTIRRVLPCRLVSPLERPEERAGFRYPDLRAHVREHRGELVRAALVVLAAYCVADRPDQKLKPWGSFEGWSNLVRSAIVFTGEPDPAGARTEIVESGDRDADTLAEVIAGWAALDPHGVGVTVADALDACEPQHPGSEPAPLLGALRALTRTPPGKPLDPRRVGMALASVRDRPVGGRCLKRLPKSSAGIRWTTGAPEGCE